MTKAEAQLTFLLAGVALLALLLGPWVLVVAFAVFWGGVNYVSFSLCAEERMAWHSWGVIITALIQALGWYVIFRAW